MSHCRGFCVNADTMGLTLPHKQKQEAQQEKSHAEQVMDDEQVLQVRDVPLGTGITDERLKKILELRSRLPPSSMEDAPGSSSSHSAANMNDYHNRLNKLREICGDEGMMTFSINNIYLKRLHDADYLDQEGSGDSLRLATFQDWVDMLLQVNQELLANMPVLELEAYKKTICCFQSVRGEQQDVLNENRKLRKDICAITKLVQEAYHHNNWNTEDIALESITINQLLGIHSDQNRPESESERVKKNMRSLANEVAAKHDEFCHLQAQMCELDEVVQTARQKIILKDKCIAQLNQQMADLQDCLSKMTQDSNNPTSHLEAEDYSAEYENMEYTSCSFDRISEKEQTSELLRMLNKELDEFIELNSKQKFADIEGRRKLLSCYFERMSSYRDELLRKLETIRFHLQSLDGDWDLLEAPLTSNTQMADGDIDLQIIDSLHRRLYTINEANKELNRKIRLKEGELMELCCKYDAERNLNLKSHETIKEIADLLNKLSCSTLSNEEIEAEVSNDNPYCKDILTIYTELRALEKCQEQSLPPPSNSESKTPASTTTTTTTAKTTFE